MWIFICKLQSNTNRPVLRQLWSLISKRKKEKKNPPPQSKPHKYTLMPLVSSSSNEPMSKASAALTSPRGGIKGGGYWKSQRRRVRLPGDRALGPACCPIKSLLRKTSRCHSLCSTHSSSHNHSTWSAMAPKGEAPSTTQLLEAERLWQGRRGYPHPQTPWGWSGRTRALTLRLNRRD